jgi:muconolactone delta-isomerase
VEYLVTMTTHVPEGTAEETVTDVRARESENSARLAEQRRMLRLWRPPLGPGEWRSIGLFTAPDPDDLEAVLSGMPLRIWRTDEVTPLLPHRNDPPEVPADDPTKAEFLTVFHLAIPKNAASDEVNRARAGEADQTRELSQRGLLVRLWELEPSSAEPGVDLALGLWRAENAAEVHAVLESLPLKRWMTIDTTPLTRHPSDPGLNAA